MASSAILPLLASLPVSDMPKPILIGSSARAETTDSAINSAAAGASHRDFADIPLSSFGTHRMVQRRRQHNVNDGDAPQPHLTLRIRTALTARGPASLHACEFRN